MRSLSGSLRSRPSLAYPLALACAVVAFLLRLSVDSLLDISAPFLTFMPAVILATYVLGKGPGLTCAMASGIMAWYFFLPPKRSFDLPPATLITLVFYVVVIGIDVALIDHLQRSRSALVARNVERDRLYREQRTLFEELQHRVANNMQFVASLLVLQRRSVERQPEAALAAFDEAGERLASFANLHRRLYDPDLVARPVGPYLQALCADHVAASGVRGVTCRVEADPIRLDLARLTTVSLLVVELLTNALKHAFPQGQGGTIAVTLADRARDGLFELSVADDGPGLPPDFDPDASRSLGVRIVRSLAGQLGGRLEYEDAGPGTRVRLAFPAG